jgi:hypothetical protein
MSDIEGADVLVTRFQGDTGEADPDLRGLLAGPVGFGEQRRIVDVLAGGRLLIPVVAAVDEYDEGGGDKRSHMAAVTLTDPRGRKALLCFSGVDAVSAWRADARPIPVAGPEAAQAALQDGCDAILIDVAGPARHALAGTGLWALAAGRPWRHPLEEPEIAEILHGALADSGLPGRFVTDDSTIDGVALILTEADVPRAESLARVLGQTPQIRARVSRLDIRFDYAE